MCFAHSCWLIGSEGFNVRNAKLGVSPTTIVEQLDGNADWLEKVSTDQYSGCPKIKGRLRSQDSY
jgi:hypothetical protein